MLIKPTFSVLAHAEKVFFILGGATHYVSSVTEQTPAQARKTELKPLNENLRIQTAQNYDVVKIKIKSVYDASVQNSDLSAREK